MTSPVLTQRFIETVKPPAKARDEYKDASLPGFRFRVTASGVKSYSILFRVNGVQKRHTIGTAAVYTLTKARELARQARQLADQGIDPTERRAAGDDTFAAAWDRYLEEHVKPNLRSARKMERTGERDILPTLGKLKLETITRQQVRGLLERIAIKQQKPVQANLTRSFLVMFWTWALDKDLATTNVAKMLKPPAKKRERTHVIADKDLGAILKAARAETSLTGRIVELLALTLARRDEVRCLQWQELDLKAATWTLPAERSKNGKSHVVPLVLRAVDILKTTPQLDERFVFSVRAGKAFSQIPEGKARIAEAAKVKGWRLHDLRRTGATGLQKLGVSDEIVGRCLNHSHGSRLGVTARYATFDKVEEKRQALALWADKLESLTKAS